MKSILLVIVSIFSISTVAAPASMCVTVPDTLRGTIQPNFDGTFTYGEPQLLMNGGFSYVGYSADGFCVAIGKKNALYSEQMSLKVGDSVVGLNEDGSIRFSDDVTPNFSGRGFKKVICE